MKTIRGRQSDDHVIYIQNSLAVYLPGNDFCQSAGTLAIGMDAVGKHLIAIVGEKGVQVDDLQAVLVGHLLLNGDDAVHDDRVVDVPRRLEGRNGGAEEDLRLEI